MRKEDHVPPRGKQVLLLRVQTGSAVFDQGTVSLQEETPRQVDRGAAPAMQERINTPEDFKPTHRRNTFFAKFLFFFFKSRILL